MSLYKSNALQKMVRFFGPPCIIHADMSATPLLNFTSGQNSAKFGFDFRPHLPVLTICTVNKAPKTSSDRQIIYLF